MTKRFFALRFFAGLYVLCGALLVLAPILLLIFWTNVKTPEVRRLLNTPVALLTAISILVACAIVGISWMAFGQLLQVFMQIEENTRKDQDVQGPRRANFISP
jgi:amino acid permease